MRARRTFLLLLGAGILAAACAGPGARIPAPPPVGGESGLYCSVRGEGEVGTLVLGAAWLEEGLAIPGAIAFGDLQGRGRSCPPPRPEGATLEADVAALEVFRRHLGGERLAIVGWSYEAAVALHYAMAHPDRVERLVLLCPLPPRRDPHWTRFRGRYAERVAEEDLARIEDLRGGDASLRESAPYHRAVLRAMLRGYGSDPRLLEATAARPYPPPNADPDAGAALRRAIHEGLGNWDWRGELAAVRIPVLIVHGRRDSFPLEGSAEYAELLPDARLLVLEEAGHFPWLEAPTELADAVQAFLDER